MWFYCVSVTKEYQADWRNDKACSLLHCEYNILSESIDVTLEQLVVIKQNSMLSEEVWNKIFTKLSQIFNNKQYMTFV